MPLKAIKVKATSKDVKKDVKATEVVEKEKVDTVKKEDVVVKKVEAVKKEDTKKVVKAPAVKKEKVSQKKEIAVKTSQSKVAGKFAIARIVNDTNIVIKKFVKTEDEAKKEIQSALTSSKKGYSVMLIEVKEEVTINSK